MKKIISTLAVSALASLTLVACGSGNNNEQPEVEPAEAPSAEIQARIGMMTDSGSIDDKSFNQGTWTGIERFRLTHGKIESDFIQPADATTTDYIQTAENLILAGNEMIISPGFTFEDAILELQDRHSEVKFVIIDGQPNVDGEAVIADNTTAIFFAEEQAGFLAGVAAALETETGKVGFIGGISIPPVQRFGWGFLAGVAYANEALGLDVQVAGYHFAQTFSDPAVGRTLAGGMYDLGIDIIFAAAGAVGSGVISEAITRTEAGEDVFVIGVDMDQFDDGLMANGESVILTSAIKRVDTAAYEMIEAFLDGTFPGGEVVVLGAAEDGVGLPDENPNLSDETQTKVDDVLGRIKSGEIAVPATAETLETWLEEIGFDATGIDF